MKTKDNLCAFYKKMSFEDIHHPIQRVCSLFTCILNCCSWLEFKIQSLLFVLCFKINWFCKNINSKEHKLTTTYDNHSCQFTQLLNFYYKAKETPCTLRLPIPAQPSLFPANSSIRLAATKHSIEKKPLL